MVREPWLGTQVWCYAGRVPTLVEALDRAVAGHPERAMLVGDGVATTSPNLLPSTSRAACPPAGPSAPLRVTYREFGALVEGAAETLAGLGLRRGDRVAVALPNGLAITVAIWACARAGLILVGLSTRLAPSQWAYQLRQSRARVALGGPEQLEGLRAAAAETGLPPGAVREGVGVLTGRRLAWRGDAVAFPDQDDVYALIYTSGTTGRPKGSKVVHRGTMHAAHTYLRTFGLIADDVTLLTFPLSYATAHMAQVAPLMLAGGCSVTIDDVTAPAIVEAIAAHRVTYLMVVPSLWPLLLRQPGFRWPDLRHLRTGAFGGSPVPTSSIAALRERLPQLRLYDAYGLTETHSPATILLDQETWRRPGTVGRPIPGVEARVVDEAGADLPPGEPGELLLRGPNITPGYWDDDEATAAAIRDGWLRTGDLARIDDEGYIAILDRTKDMIIRGGFKVYSVELEYLLVSHPDIAEAAVVGLPDTRGEEAVAALVVPRDGATLTVPQVRAWVADRMADYAVPRHVRLVNAIPRNRTGKVDKHTIRATWHAAP